LGTSGDRRELLCELDEWFRTPPNNDEVIYSGINLGITLCLKDCVQGRRNLAIDQIYSGRRDALIVRPHFLVDAA